jgi:repressor LexA
MSPVASASIWKDSQAHLIEKKKIANHSFEWYMGRMEHEPLTSAQAQILSAIRLRVERGEAAPSYRDLCAEFGWASTGTARDHLQALARKGYITLGGGRARQIRLVESPLAVARVRLLGHVVAGRPEAAAELPDGEVAVPASWLGRGRHFALQVVGDSMTNAAIIDGDTVIVREQEGALDGEIVVATVGGETTVKRLRLDGDNIRLLPENTAFAPIEVREEDFKIHGVVVAVMRSLAPQPNTTRQMRERRSHTFSQQESARHG